MSLVRVQSFSISLDGFGTGEPQSFESPFGHAGGRLHEWMMATRWWRRLQGQPGGTEGVDDAFARQFADGIGVEIMGAGKFGPPGWQQDPDWRGWWGEDPPFHTPVLVLTRHPRPAIAMDGGTTFHFLDVPPVEALAAARRLAADAGGGPDVRIGGGPTVVRDFVAAGLVDHLHLVVVPIVLGHGVRLWHEKVEALQDDYDIESTISAGGVTHLTFTRRAG